jgi:hypothetical protein
LLEFPRQALKFVSRHLLAGFGGLAALTYVGHPVAIYRRILLLRTRSPW